MNKPLEIFITTKAWQFLVMLCITLAIIFRFFENNGRKRSSSSRENRKQEEIRIGSPVCERFVTWHMHRMTMKHLSHLFLIAFRSRSDTIGIYGTPLKSLQNQRLIMGPRDANQSPPLVRHLSSSDPSSVSSGGDESITILGFGSLLSENSSRLTFPDLKSFRLCRVPNYRRVFAHPASIFFQRGIADIESLQMSSLSVEYEEVFPGFVASVFEVPNSDMMADGIPSQAFLEREEEFSIIEVPFVPLDGGNSIDSEFKGVICARSTDEAYLKRWGADRFQDNFQKYGVDTIWGWSQESGLRPCAVYLRHCYLAAKSMGETSFDSFLDETFLVDRETTIRQYVERHPEVLLQQPPAELVSRYSG
jgi:hypothetical protein